MTPDEQILQSLFEEYVSLEHNTTTTMLRRLLHCEYLAAGRNKEFAEEILDGIFDNDKKVENVVGNNFVLVDQKLRIDKTNLEDMITYGIDPDTRKINTPIWSRLQNRLINIYSEEEIKKVTRL